MLVPAGVEAITRQEATLSVLILDSSGSMKRFGDAPQSVVNEHLSALLNPPDGREQYCMVVTFADAPKLVVPLAHARQIHQMTSYQPGGGTLLYETVDRVMRGLTAQLEKSGLGQLRIVVGIFSDGQDNKSDSSRYPGALQRCATRVRNVGWELLTFGIGINGPALARSIGFPDDAQHAYTVAATAAGVTQAGNTMTGSTTSFHAPARPASTPTPR